MRKSRWILSLSFGALRSRDVPLVAHCRSRWDRSGQLLPVAAVLVVRLLPVPGGERLLLQISGPPASVKDRLRVWGSISSTEVTVRARKARSCETITVPPLKPSTNCSRTSSPAKSRSLVGSSRSEMSKRDKVSAASPARASSPAGERRHGRPEQVGGGPQGGQAGRRPLLETPRVDLVEPGQGAVVTLLCGRAQVSRRRRRRGPSPWPPRPRRPHNCSAGTARPSRRPGL